MDFRTLSLPQDNDTLRQAWKMYEAAARPVTRDNSPALHRAEILYARGVEDTDTLCLAILADMPANRDGEILHAFGGAFTALLMENRFYDDDVHGDLARASPPVRRVMVASVIAGLEAEMSPARQRERGGNYGYVFMETLMGLDAFRRAMEGTTGAPRLEEALQEKLRDGFVLFVNGKPRPENYPPYEKTGLPQSESAFGIVRRAYDFLTRDMKVPLENLAPALDVAGVLATVPEVKEPETIAAALVDMALPGRGPRETGRIMTELGAGVASIILRHTVHAVYDAEKMKQAPLPFQQIAVARKIHILDTLCQKDKALAARPDRDEAQYRANKMVMRHTARAVRDSMIPLLRGIGEASMEWTLRRTLKDVEDSVGRDAGAGGPAFARRARKLSS